MSASPTGRSTPVLRTLSNGASLLALPMPHVRSASMGVFLRVGSRDETARTNGIGHVLEHMAFKGTTTRAVQTINLDAERLGADVNAFTGKDTAGYFMTGLARDLHWFTRMTADIVLNSTFPADELARELEVIRQEAVEYQEDPEDFADDLLDRAIWGSGPMGMPVIGPVSNIERFTREDLVRHVRSHYVADKTLVVAAGNFDVDAWLALADDLFSGMRRSCAPDASRAPAPAAYVGGALGRRFTQLSQVFVNLAYPLTAASPGDPPGHRWRVAASLAAHLFGAGMSSPLIDTLRERLGLAYTVDAAVDSGDAWSTFVVHAVTTPDKLAALVKETGELLRAQAAHIDPVQLERAKNQLTVSRVRAAERTYATMERAAEDFFATATVMPMDEALAMIEDIGASEVQGVFERMLAHPPALAITGKGASTRTARELAALLSGAAH